MDKSNVKALCDAAVNSISSNEQSMANAKNRYNANKIPCYIDVILYVNSVAWRKKVAMDFKQRLKDEGVSAACAKRFSENTVQALKHVKGLKEAANEGKEAVETLLNELGITTESELKRAAKIAAGTVDPVEQIVKKFEKLDAEEQDAAMAAFQEIVDARGDDEEDEGEDEGEEEPIAA